MNIKTVFTLFVLTLFAAGCSSMKVTSDQQAGYDFAAINTYQWIPGPAEILNEEDTYINDDIQASLNAELKNAGLNEAAETSVADMQIAYYVKLKEELEYTDMAPQDDRQFSGGFVYNRDRKDWKYEEREPDINVYAVEIGTLTVLAYDAETGERIWRGTLRTKLDRSKQEQHKALIDVAAEKLMSRFPAAKK
jgi:hypothetical protein